MQEIYRDMGKWIATLRKSRKWSQGFVAKQMKVSRTSIANIEAGRQRFYVDDLVRFALLFEVDPLTILPTRKKRDWIRL